MANYCELENQKEQQHETDIGKLLHINSLTSGGQIVLRPTLFHRYTYIYGLRPWLCIPFREYNEIFI